MAETPDSVKDHPALKGLTIPRTGRGGGGRDASTKTLDPASAADDDVDRRRGAMLRAYDKATGKDAGAVYMPRQGQRDDYMRQAIIVVAVSGGRIGRADRV
jgi:quinoprotein glucose dehydrogenase